MITTLVQAASTREFAAGLRCGVVAFVAGLVLALMWRTGGDESPAPIGGFLLAAATVIALADTGRLPDGLILGLVALAIGGLLADMLAAPPVALAVLVMPGAWIVGTQTGLGTVAWVQALVVAVTVVGSVAVTDFDTRWARSGAGPLLLAISIVGVFATVPDTEQVLVLAGAIGPLILLSWPLPLAILGPGGACAVVGLLAWVAGAGGMGRFASVIGAVATLGLLLAEPVSRWLDADRRGPLDRMSDRTSTIVLLAAAHAVMVVIASRIAGLQTSVPLAAVISATAFLASVAVGRLLTQSTAPHAAPIAAPTPVPERRLRPRRAAYGRARPK